MRLVARKHVQSVLLDSIAQSRIFNCEVDRALHRTIEGPRPIGREAHDAAVLVVFKLLYQKERSGKVRGHSVE